MKKKIHPVVLHLGRITLRVGRWTWYLSAILLVLLAVLFSLARYYLPVLAERKSELEIFLSQKASHPVHIEQLTVYWEGIHPGLRAQGLQLSAVAGAPPAIRLSEVRLTLALLPLLRGKLGINSLAVVNPKVLLERLADGSFRVTGYDLLRTEQTAGNEKMVDWLFQQSELVIENGEIFWSDHKQYPVESLRFSKVNLSLKNNGNRHRVGFGAVFPQEICGECSLIVDITGNPLAVSDWSGEIYLRAKDLSVTHLPAIAREHLPGKLHGKFTTQLWTEWDEGWPSSVTGHIDVADLKLPIPGWNAPLSVKQAGGDMNWRTKGKGWRLDLANLSLGLSGPSWPAGHVRVTHLPDESDIQISHLNLDDITRFVEAVKTDMPETAPTNAAFAYWLNSKPRGAVDRFNFLIDGDWSAPTDFSMEADAKGVHVLPYLNFPGVSGFDARLEMTRTSGSAKLNANDATLSLPNIFRDALPIQHASGDLTWKKSNDEWVVHGEALHTVSADASGTGKLLLRVPLDTTVSPYLNLRVDFRDGDSANASRYYPVKHLRPGTREWMERSFVAGKITQGHLIYDGLIREFPFRDGHGKFELRGQVRNAVYRYLPGWEPITQAQVDVAIDGPEVRVTGNGKIAGLDAQQVVVLTHQDADKKNWVYVSGDIRGPVNETLNVLHAAGAASPSAKWPAYLPPSLHGSGTGALNLNIAIPLSDLKSLVVAGDYRLANAGLKFDDAGLELRALDGSVRFTQLGIHDGKLRGEFLGGATTLSAEQVQDNLVLQALGNVQAQGLTPLLGARVAAHLSGNTHWSAVWRQGMGLGKLAVIAELRHLKSTLPPPLNQPEALARDQLQIKSELSTLDSHVLGITLGKQLNGKLALVHDAGGWSLASGHIGFGEEHAALSRERGLYLSAHLDDVDLDQWLGLLGEGQRPLPAMITRLSADVRSVKIIDRKLENLSFDLSRRDETWSGVVNGPQASGKINISGTGSARRIGLDLTHLVLPDPLGAHGNRSTDPRHLPALTVHSQSFQVMDKQLGEFDFSAAPVADGWKIERMLLTRPEMKLSVNGMWRQVGDEQKSECSINFQSSDMGKTMEAFGAPDQLAGAEVNVTSHLAWPGSPAAMVPVNLNGTIEVSAKKGRFLQVKPGAGRLFGLLDLSAVGRYLTLDFSPVFGKGLIFDQITGTVTVEHGNAYSQDLIIKSPAAMVSAGGRVGLGAEDFDLTIYVQPKLSDGLTLATWGIWGPQVAATVLAMQKIFKKQIAAGTRVTYTVKGPWDNPMVSKTTKGDAKKTQDAAPITGE